MNNNNKSSNTHTQNIMCVCGVEMMNTYIWKTNELNKQYPFADLQNLLHFLSKSISFSRMAALLGRHDIAPQQQLQSKPLGWQPMRFVAWRKMGCVRIWGIPSPCTRYIPLTQFYTILLITRIREKSLAPIDHCLGMDSPELAQSLSMLSRFLLVILPFLVVPQVLLMRFLIVVGCCW